MLAFERVLLTWLSRGAVASYNRASRRYNDIPERATAVSLPAAALFRVAPSASSIAPAKHEGHRAGFKHILLTHGGIGFGTRAAGSFGVSSG